MFANEKDFKTAVHCLPLVSLDMVVFDPFRNKMLMGLRKNEPAQGVYFVLGGRVRKNETLEEAFGRISMMEFKRALPLSKARNLGVFQHFYPTGFGGVENGTHYIALGAALYRRQESLPLHSLPGEQHSSYVWLGEKEIRDPSLTHPNNVPYFEQAKKNRWPWLLAKACGMAPRPVFHLSVIGPQLQHG